MKGNINDLIAFGLQMLSKIGEATSEGKGSIEIQSKEVNLVTAIWILLQMQVVIAKHISTNKDLKNLEIEVELEKLYNEMSNNKS